MLKGLSMKNFVIPEIEDLSEVVLEPVYTASGWTPENPPEDPTPKGDWDISTHWCNHNSGSHSELAIVGVHSGKTCGESITMVFQCIGFCLNKVKDNGGFIVSNETESGFTITRFGHFNPTERFEFNIQVTAKDSLYHGAVGKTGEQVVGKSVKCISYFSN